MALAAPKLKLGRQGVGPGSPGVSRQSGMAAVGDG